MLCVNVKKLDKKILVFFRREQVRMNTHLILHDSSLYEKVQSAEWKYEWIEDRE